MDGLRRKVTQKYVPTFELPRTKNEPALRNHTGCGTKKIPAATGGKNSKYSRAKLAVAQKKFQVAQEKLGYCEFK